MPTAHNPTQRTALVAQAASELADDAPLVRANATIIDGPDLGLAFPLGFRPTTVGKSRDCEVALTDRAVSKRHLQLSLVGSAVRVRDLESTNGSFVGKTRIIESIVPLGTVINLGRTRIHVRSEEEPMVLTPSSSNHFGELWGKSVAMRQLFAVLERVASKDANILVDGETGTGKELVARSVHQRSGRGEGPLVVLDCSAVAPELVESQLFGHKRGSFTGAMQDRRGVFEAARGGTVFLDELDSLPLDLQPKLLRVLEAREVVRLGESSGRGVDVRIIAACGRSPEEAVAKGSLRRDLYFRLAVVRVTLPALRDRVADVPLLASRLLEQIQPGHGIVVEEGPAMDRLRKHAWMGNVRELRNVLERALLLASPGVTSLDQLPLRLSPILAGSAQSSGAPRGPRVDLRLPFKEAKEAAVRAFESEYLRAALSRNGANLSKTARDVGLTRHHLRKLLREHGLIAGGK